MACGACCSHARAWPRFSLETDQEIARIPSVLIDEPRGRMRVGGERCSALLGEVGVATRCAVYRVRPIVCRDCQPGDDACREARAARGMESVAAV